MRTAIYFILLLLQFQNLIAQEKITVAQGSFGAYIETYKKSWSDNFIIDEAYRIGPSGLKTLKEGLKTGLNWVKLNETHQKTFQKEICRFKVMEKEKFKFHGYVDEFSEEMTLLFHGYADGSFKLEIKQYNGYRPFITISDFDMLQSFKNMLDGKSANAEIDDIFKN